ncbi:non-ribosomal peptide synthetase [Blastopirellula retiformator]|uniref:Linear gramicidin synthase subunit D n=1 Tax=Blastopirellula retiformator TaxID=2527970 RepID=A0A5C5VLI5_9BACT|nr:non-ribosomal peptide synthetase [Blastopirellula retiformator]TWT38923.1 Linear gramicidin synthase subunit D [Blastopirellula retiformator]
MDEIAQRLSKLTPEKRALYFKRLHQLSVQQTSVRPRDPGQSIPLSFAQQRLWTLGLNTESERALHLACRAQVRGALNRESLEVAFRQWTQRHEVLRTAILCRGIDPIQVPLAESPETVRWEDFSGLGSEDSERLDGFCAEEIDRPFDLENGETVRMSAIRLGPDEFEIVIVIHHLVSDEISMVIALGELSHLYEAHSSKKQESLPQLPIQFADFTLWERDNVTSHRADDATKFWRSELNGYAPQTEQLGQRVKEFCRREFEFSIAQSNQIRDLARELSTTPFIIALSSFAVALSSVSGRQDRLIGTLISNRNAQTEGLVGCFHNLIPIRVRVQNHPKVDFQSVVRQIRDSLLSAAHLRDVPIEAVVEDVPQLLSDLSWMRLLFLQREVRSATDRFASMNMEIREVENPFTTADLQGSLVTGLDQFRIVLQHNESLFSVHDVTQIEHDMRCMIERLLTSQTKRAYSSSVLVHHNERVVKSDKTFFFQGFHDQILRQAQDRGDEVAIETPRSQLEYRDLRARIGRIAGALSRERIQAEEAVAVCLPPCEALPIALLGVIVAGGTAVPLNHEDPPQRLRKHIEASDAKFIVAARDDLLSSVTKGLKLIDPSEIIEPRFCSDDERCSRELIHSITLPGQVAFLMFTSGSTGDSKGVMVTHGAISNLLKSIAKFVLPKPSDAVLAISPASFDISLLEYFLPLWAGARVVIAPSTDRADSARLIDLIHTKRVTIVQATPVGWRLLIEGEQRLPDGLRILCGGDALSVDLAKTLAGAGTAWNVYGPTEATVWTSYSDLTTDVGDDVSIGCPLHDTRLIVVNDDLQECANGTIGELCIGGVGLARGYFDRPDLTAAAFVPDPNPEFAGQRLYRTGDLARRDANNRIVVLGRSDSQVKVRGYRIELREIEAALESHHDVETAVVLTYVDASELPALVAYVTSSASAKQLQEHISTILPQYMVPSRIQTVSRFPLTTHGKIDRKELSKWTEREGESASPPATSTEKLLCEIWTDVLKVSSLGIHDNFFMMGGHSLLAARIMTRIQATLGLKVPVRVLFDFPTIQSLANELESIGVKEDSPSSPRRRWDTLRDLSFNQQELLRAVEAFSEPCFCNINAIVKLSGPIEYDVVSESCKSILQRHDILRSRVINKDDAPKLQLSGVPDTPVEFIDLSLFPPSIREMECNRTIQWYSEQAIDVTDSLPIRFVLLKIDAITHVFILVVHHFVADGWSLNVIGQELIDSYLALVNHERVRLPKIPFQYADYASWEHEHFDTVIFPNVSWWRDKLENNLCTMRFGNRVPSDVAEQFSVSRHVHSLCTGLTDRIQRTAKSKRWTVAQMIVAGICHATRDYTEEGIVTVGTVMDGRTIPGLDRVIGPFSNPVILRVDTNDCGPSELVLRTREEMLSAEEHQLAPIGLVASSLEGSAGFDLQNLAPIMFVFQSFEHWERGLREESLHAEWAGQSLDVPSYVPTFTKIWFEVLDLKPDLQLIVDYKTADLENSRVRRIVESLEHSLEDLLAEIGNIPNS